MTTKIEQYKYPVNFDLERGVLNSIMTTEYLITEAVRILGPDMFASPENRDVYKAMIELYDANREISLSSLLAKVDSAHVKSVLGAVDYAPSLYEFKFSCMDLRELYIKRYVYDHVVEILAECSSVVMDAGTVKTMVYSLQKNLENTMKDVSGTRTIGEVFGELATELEKREELYKSGKSIKAPSGFGSIDMLTHGGFEKGELVIIAARPAVGKSTIALQIAKCAADSGNTALFISLEMPAIKIAERAIVSTHRVYYSSISSGTVNWESFEKSVTDYGEDGIYINDTVRTLEEIRGEIINQVHAGKCKLAVIDYLGLISMSGASKMQRTEQIQEMTRILKLLAMQLQIPIVLLCQLNRASVSEKREPQLYDLRESGSIEQDADIVLMLDDKGWDSQHTHWVDLFVRKNRNGSVGSMHLKADPTNTFFLETVETITSHIITGKQ